MIGIIELWRRKTQFGLIVLIVTLISYLVIMINGLGVGLNQAAGSALMNFDADAIAFSDKAGLSVIRSEMGADAVEAASTAPGVEDSAPLGYVAANYERADGSIKSLALMGYDPGTIAEPDVVSGSSLEPADGYGLIADGSLLEAAGLRVGDTVNLRLRLTSQEFTIVGETDQGSFFFQPTAFILRSTWQELKYGQLPESEQPVASVVLLQGNDLAGLEGEGFEVVDKPTAFANIEGVSGQQSTVVSLRIFGLVIGGLVIGAFFFVLTMQKVPQIGVLKAIGASTAFVFRQVLAQVLVVWLIGVAISLPMAYLTERLLESLPEGVPIAFTGETFIGTAVSLLVAAVGGAMLSGWQVLRIDPIIALGQQQ
jgi:putative ABC transport system permease protein